MSAESRYIATGSQTVGPYFRIGLECLMASAPASDSETAITIRGRVFDRDRAPVPDAMLEFWSPGCKSDPSDFPRGFRRVGTDIDGAFMVTMPQPEPMAGQAPHWLVLIFARGLLRHLISRVYLEHEGSNAGDAVLSSVPFERRSTLIACSDGPALFRWDVILQGADETVFFAW